MDQFNCIVRLRILREGEERESAFGKGTALLLQGIDELHSLNQAAKRLGMSYSKAWKGLKAAEENLGFMLVERKGQRGSVLTEQGRHFLRTYNLAEAVASAAAEAVLQSHDFQDSSAQP